MPCDAITIPKISLYPWKEGYHHHPYHQPVVVKPSPYVAQPAAPALVVSPAPYSPQPAQYASREPKYSPLTAFPTSYPTPSTRYSSQTPIKSFVHSRFPPTPHSPLARYGVLGK